MGRDGYTDMPTSAITATNTKEINQAGPALSINNKTPPTPGLLWQMVLSNTVDMYDDCTLPTPYIKNNVFVIRKKILNFAGKFIIRGH